MTMYWVWVKARNENNEEFEFLERVRARNRYMAEALCLDMYRWALSAKAV